MKSRLERTRPAPPSGPEPLVIPLWHDGPSCREAEEECIDRSPDPERPDRSVRNVRRPTLYVYLPDTVEGPIPAALICPGGGYARVTLDKEGTEAARWLTTLGIAGMVLKYRLPAGALDNGSLPLPLQDGFEAIRTIRSRSAEWGIDTGRIGALGFSAGAHLAALLGLELEESTRQNGTPPAAPGSTAANGKAGRLAIPAAAGGLAFLALIYPVITMKDPFANAGCRRLLLGPDAPPDPIERYSAETLVRPGAPPAFLVHARDDEAVRVENSILFQQSMQRAGNPCDLHLYARGGHAFGLGRSGPISHWPERCRDWLERRGIL